MLGAYKLNNQRQKITTQYGKAVFIRLIYEIYYNLIKTYPMGNDGGDIPGRKELVRQKKKVETPTSESIALGRSRFCNLSKQPFKEPLAICRLGNIYNYQTLLQLLVKKELPSKYEYVKKLTDIKKIIIQRTSTNQSNNFIMCPITKLQYNGLNKFVAFWPCGHVVSRKALKEVQSEERTCIICHEAYKDEHLIDLNLQRAKAEYYRMKMLEKVKKKQVKQEEQVKDLVRKKVKTDAYINSTDRLGGQFRDVIRNRDNFKKLFKPQEQLDWQTNTYFADKKDQEKVEKVQKS